MRQDFSVCVYLNKISKISGVNFAVTINQDDNQKMQIENTNSTDSPSKDDENKSLNQSGDPGRTPGSAEGDEETIDEDIREKEAEGKL